MTKLKFVLNLNLKELKTFKEKVNEYKKDFEKIPNPTKTIILIKKILGENKESMFKSFILGIEVGKEEPLNEEIITLLENRGYLIK